MAEQQRLQDPKEARWRAEEEAALLEKKAVEERECADEEMRQADEAMRWEEMAKKNAEEEKRKHLVMEEEIREMRAKLEAMGNK